MARKLVSDTVPNLLTCFAGDRGHAEGKNGLFNLQQLSCFGERGQKTPGKDVQSRRRSWHPHAEPEPSGEMITASFIDFEDFKAHGSIPRLGSGGKRGHGTSHTANGGSLCRHHTAFNRQTTAFVFISHRWCEDGLPDNEQNDKFELIVEAC